MREIHTEIFVSIKGLPIIPINEPEMVEVQFTVLKKKQGSTRHRTMGHQILNISDTVYCLLSTYTAYHLLSTVYSLLSTVYSLLSTMWIEISTTLLLYSSCRPCRDVCSRLFSSKMISHMKNGVTMRNRVKFCLSSIWWFWNFFKSSFKHH